MNEKQINVTMRELLVRIVRGRTEDLESEERFQKFLKKLEPLKGTVSPDDLSEIEQMTQEEFTRWLDTIVDPKRPSGEIKQYLRELAEQIEEIDEGKMLSLTQKLSKLRTGRLFSKFPWFRKK